ncbi:MAG: ABC transporter permease [Gemmatimonadaceae bacterium]
MGKLFVVAKREYLERVRSRWFLISTFLGPVLMSAIIILPAWLSLRSKSSDTMSHMVVLDATGTGLGQRVMSEIIGGPMNDTAAAVVRVVSPSEIAAAESLATRDVMSKKFEGYLVLDSASVKGTAARYAGRNASTIPDMERIEGAVRQSLLTMRLQAAGMDPDRVKVLSNVKVKLATERITDSGRGGSGQVSVIFAFAIAFLLYTSILLYGQSILRGVIEEKTTRVAEVVVASVSPDALLGGKVLGVGGVGLTQVGIWMISSALLVRYREPFMARLGIPSVPFGLPSVTLATGAILIAFFVLGFILYSSLFAAVGAMVSNDQDAQQAATPVTLLAVFSIIFLQPVILNPTSQLAKVVSWLPFSAPIIMPARLSLIAISPMEIGLVLAGAFAGCVATVWLAARIYRVGILMYGKKPSLAELAHWIRQAR